MISLTYMYLLHDRLDALIFGDKIIIIVVIVSVHLAGTYIQTCQNVLQRWISMLHLGYVTSWFLIALTPYHLNNILRIDMLVHSNVYPDSWVKRFLFFNAAFWLEKHQIPILFFCLHRPGLEHAIYRISHMYTRRAHWTLHYRGC
jgi:hypothetical protein